MRPLCFAPLSVLLLAACGSDPCASCPEGTVCLEDRCEPCAEGVPGCEEQLPAPICAAGTQWAPGRPAFREVTAEWGLTGVEGVRLTVADIDGDGWPDLEVRRGPSDVEDFTTPAGRRTWLLRNDGRRFEDVTEASGLLARRNEGGGGRPVQIVAWGDVDNDGDLDLYSGLGTDDWERVGFESSELLLNDGSGRFTLSALDNPIRRAEDSDSPAGASFVDVDRDGWLDLWVPQHNGSTRGSLILRQDRLWRGDGTGRFVDATDALGLTTLDWLDLDTLDQGLGHSRAWSAVACDLNGDGLAELLAASYGRSPNHLWQARAGASGPRYENRSVASGFAYDADLTWQDNQFARCFCQANRAAEGCESVPAPLVSCSPNWSHATDRRPARLGGNSGATVCADLDNDGHLDLVQTEIRHWWAGAGSDESTLLYNDGGADPVFVRPGREALGLRVERVGTSWDEGHMTAAAFDFDNDGWPDLYLGASDYPGNRGLLFQQVGPRSYREVPPGEGIDHNRSHGVVVADFDRDGDLDVVVGHSRARCGPPNDCYPTSQIRLFENLAGDGGNFVQLRLEGAPGANRAAIGARVRVTAGGVTQTQEVGGGYGHYGAQNDLVLHFGLGAACEAEVEVRWPDASLTVERLTLPAGHRFHVRQGARARRVP